MAGAAGTRARRHAPPGGRPRGAVDAAWRGARGERAPGPGRCTCARGEAPDSGRRRSCFSHGGEPMTQPALHVTPGLRDVLVAQVRAVGFVLRGPAIAAAALAGV